MNSKSRITFHASRFTPLRFGGYSVSRLAVLAAILFSVVYIFVAFNRVLYPYDIDFVEDSMLMQSLRVANGQLLYVPPTSEFAPHVYMPLYTWLGGLVFKFTAPGFVPLRLLSLAATLATAVMIYWIVRRESGLRWLALACAGLWLGGYKFVDGWYELARVDALFVALTLAGLALGIYAHASNRGVILSAAVMALAFFTKQTNVIFSAGLALYLSIAIGKRVWLFVVMYAVLVAAPILILNASTQGWFGYYAFGIASLNPIEANRILSYARFELFGQMALLSMMALFAAVAGLRRSGLGVIRDRPWLMGLSAAVIVSGMGRASVGGAVNNLMPVYALLCLAPAILIREFHAHTPLDNEQVGADGSVTHRSFISRLSPLGGRSGPTLVAAAIVIQFILGAYNPLRFIPTSEMRQGGDRLIERIKSINGEVFVMMHPYYALLAGKRPSAQIAVVWYARERGSSPLPQDLVDRFQRRYYAAIISDETLFELDPPLRQLVEANYMRQEDLTMLDVPPTLTGMFARPTVVYVPKR